MREEFQKQIKEKNFNCTVPWILGMQRAEKFDQANMKTCNNDYEYEVVDNFGYNFAQNASTYSHPKCPGKYEYTCTLGTFFYVNFKTD